MLVRGLASFSAFRIRAFFCNAWFSLLKSTSQNQGNFFQYSWTSSNSYSFAFPFIPIFPVHSCPPMPTYMIASKRGWQRGNTQCKLPRLRLKKLCAEGTYGQTGI